MNKLPVIEQIIIDNTFEAMALRGSLEYFGFRVNMHYVGKAQDIVDLCAEGNDLSEFVIFQCHGNKDVIYLPELGKEIARTQPYNDQLTPSQIQEFAHFQPGTAVLNTGCHTGTESFAKAFHTCGASHYIAPTDFAEGNSSLFYCTGLFYHVSMGMTLSEAHDLSKKTDKETALFSLFQK